MFGLFRPRCPVSTNEKACVEFAYLTIRDVVGIEPLLQAAAIVPEDELAETQPCTELLLRKIAALICHNMDLDSSQFSFEARTAENADEENNDLTHIRFSEGEPIDPRVIVPLLAVRMGRLKMQQSGLEPKDAATNWWVTHLLPNYYGFGLFAANATVNTSNWSFGETGYSEIKRHSEVTSRVHAYSLAINAWCRGTHESEWLPTLRPDAAEPFSQSMAFLNKTSDCAFHTNDKTEMRYRAIQSLTDDLRKGSPSAKVIALWQLPDRTDADSVQLDVENCLFDRDSSVRATALKVVTDTKAVSDRCQDRILAALADTAPEVRHAALPACRSHADVDDHLVESVARLLDERDPGLSHETITTLISFGELSQSALPKIAKAMKQAMVSCNWEMAEILADGVRKISSDPRATLAQFFAHDQDLEEQAVAVLNGDIHEVPEV